MLSAKEAGIANRRKFAKRPSNAHLAGIIPVAHFKSSFNMPWDDSMMPIAPDYLAVENAVYECSMAGCNTIWIMCYMHMQPLIRKRIGDWIRLRTEPYAMYNNEPDRASIYYVPMNSAYVGTKDSIIWSILQSANASYHICRIISDWVIPSKFYCAFPHGIMDTQFVRKNRVLIRGDKKVYFSSGGKSIKDGLKISFTFDGEDYKKVRDVYKQYAFKKWQESGKQTVHPDYKQARNMTLEEAFGVLDFSDSICLEPSWHYDISNWEGYRHFMSSDIRLERNEEYIVGKEMRKKLEEKLNE